ncbi:4122_t:CDS:2 [Paraglomus brasilianum]|uniref:4122_t:CDS:1 n=1 Tax=Paraglomus brasilianum TaxID=144538 RepID=A0A9N9C3H5_9GLOM|nr:4122_t:CDS:2 [Paraglomus brasilianum]
MIIWQGVHHYEQQRCNPVDEYYLIVCATVGGVAVWRFTILRRVLAEVLVQGNILQEIAHGDIEIFTHKPGEQIESILFIATPSTGAPITHLCFTPASILTTHFFDIELTGEGEDSHNINHDAFEDTKVMPAPISDDASKRKLPFVVLYIRYRRRQFDKIDNVSVGEDGENGE